MEDLITKFIKKYPHATMGLGTNPNPSNGPNAVMLLNERGNLYQNKDDAIADLLNWFWGHSCIEIVRQFELQKSQAKEPERQI